MNLDESRVSYFQFKISSYVAQGDLRQVRKFQRILLRSLSSRLLIIRDIFGMKKNSLLADLFPLTSQERFKFALNLDFNLYSDTLFRFFVLKKKGLSFYFELPNLYSTCLQALCNLSVLPYTELYSDRISFGFRPHRSYTDIFLQIKQLFRCTNRFIFWYNKLDLSNFVQLNSWLVKNFPFDKSLLCNLLKNKSLFYSSKDLGIEHYYFNKSLFTTIENFLFDGLVRIFKPEFYSALTLIIFFEDISMGFKLLKEQLI